MAAAAASVASAVSRVRVPVGTALITQNDASDARYVVLRGRFVVERVGDDGSTSYLNEIGAGELIGEMAMLSSDRRAATVRAVREGDVLQLTRDAFEKLALMHPEPMRRLAQLLALRLRNEIIAAQADLLIVVAHALSSAAPSALESAIAPAVLAPRELVLLHEPGVNPSGTARWLQNHRFARHHHLGRGHHAHLHRLARRLAGCSVGLVLGGGGARGFGHIGAMRAFAESGVPIDHVGGTSMGSIMAAEVALGWDSGKMHERTRHAFRRDPLAWDNTFPFASKITCNKVVRLFQHLLGTAHAEDCWLPYFSVACSLTDARTVTQRSGFLWQCVRASSALPGLGPPVVESGKFLVDGAILNNLPADILADDGMGPVIAINVGPKEDLGTTRSDNYSLSGWRILWERLRGAAWAREYSSLLWVLQRTVLLGAVDMAERMRGVASLYLQLPLDRYEMFKWSEIDPIVELGYQSSKAQIAAWAAQHNFPVHS